jgi:hypothetical protein
MDNFSRRLSQRPDLAERHAHRLTVITAKTRDDFLNRFGSGLVANAVNGDDDFADGLVRFQIGHKAPPGKTRRRVVNNAPPV